jgi:hypothetical protein
MSRTLYGLLLILCFGYQNIQAVGYSIDRINRDGIEARKAQIVALESKSDFTKAAIKVGAITLAAIGSVAVMYSLFKNKTGKLVGVVAGQCADAIAATVTKQPLEEKIEQLKEQIGQLKDKIENSPRFGSWEWWKSCFINLALTPGAFVPIFKAIGCAGDHIAKKLFFAGNVSDFLEQTTQLGVLSLRANASGVSEKVFIKGQYAQELEHSAERLNNMDTTTGIDCEYHKKRIVYNFNRIIVDMTGLIAFMEHMADGWTASAACLATDAVDRAQYLEHITNKTSVSLELALNDTSKKQSVTDVIKDFFNELEQVLINFAQTECEYVTAQCKN